VIRRGSPLPLTTPIQPKSDPHRPAFPRVCVTRNEPILNHAANRIELRGESMRKLKAAKAKLDEAANK
jgi:hypothetical protein